MSDETIDDNDREEPADPVDSGRTAPGRRRTAEAKLRDQHRALERAAGGLPPNVASWMNAYDRITRDTAIVRADIVDPGLRLLRTNALSPPLTAADVMAEFDRRQRELAGGYRRLQEDASARLVAAGRALAAADPAEQWRRVDERIAALNRALAGPGAALGAAMGAIAGVEARNRELLARLSGGDVYLHVASEIATQWMMRDDASYASLLRMVGRVADQVAADAAASEAGVRPARSVADVVAEAADGYEGDETEPGRYAALNAAVLRFEGRILGGWERWKTRHAAAHRLLWVVACLLLLYREGVGDLANHIEVSTWRGEEAERARSLADEQEREDRRTQYLLDELERRFRAAGPPVIECTVEREAPLYADGYGKRRKIGVTIAPGTRLCLVEDWGRWYRVEWLEPSSGVVHRVVVASKYCKIVSGRPATLVRSEDPGE